MKNTKKAIQDRFTTVKYDPNFKISDESLNELIDSAQLAPSSMGLQHAELIAIKDKEFKKEIVEFFGDNNKAKVSDSSVLFLLVGLEIDFFKENNFEQIEKRKAQFLGTTKEEIADIKKMMASYITVGKWKDIQDIVSTAIMTSFITIQASDLDLGSTVMQGFDDQKLTKFLLDKKIIKKHRRVHFAITVGKTDETFDKNQLSKNNRIRVSKDEFVKII